MTENYARLLERFDPIGIARYNITARDLVAVERYLTILQSDLPHSSWVEAVSSRSEYGTSIIIHEVVQIRGLVNAGIQPFRYDQRALSKILEVHREIHAAALYEEHLYLQEVLIHVFDERYEVATLVKANHLDNLDFNRLLESDVGIFLYEEERVEHARQALARLKGR